MQLPPLPLIPIDLNQGEKDFLRSLDGKVDSILVAGREDNKLYAMGNRGGSLYFPKGHDCINSFNVKEYVTINNNPAAGITEVSSFQGPDYKNWKDLAAFMLTAGLYALGLELTVAQRARRSLQRAFHSRARGFRKQNHADIEEKIKSIRLYQGTIEEVAGELGKPLERVDTGKPETYLHKNDPFWLRMEAYLLGANAVVHYQPGSAIGTPVRFKEK